MNYRFLQPSAIYLDPRALQNNIQFIRKQAGKNVHISSVIKGNAYGHGIASFLPIAEKAGIDHFSVFSANEAYLAVTHKKNDSTRIMIMGMIRDDETEWAVENEVECYVFDAERVKAMIRAAQKLNKKAAVHLQVETGMNRTGFEEKRWEALFQTVKENREWLSVNGICTHYAGAESSDNYFRILKQDKRFQKAIALAETLFEEKLAAHASSSAAFLTHPDKHYNMVRIGIAQYGFWPSRETFMHHILSENLEEGYDPLQRVMTWKSEVMSLKDVKSGDLIGYGNVYLAGRDMTIATVPIGYTHGFGRNLTNTGYVLIQGKRCGVVGLVNMNMITVNVSHLEKVNKGDEVVLIGKQGKDEISVASFGEMTNNLNYEVLTRIPDSIPRVCKETSSAAS